MKDSKYCKYTACCWDYRHELLGIILLVIATLLTIATCNSFGIAAMFLVGLVLCCCRHMFYHCSQTHGHCHSSEEKCEMMAPLEAGDKQQVKKSTGKTKK